MIVRSAAQNPRRINLRGMQLAGRYGDLQQLMGFGGLPADVRFHILSVRGDNPGETTALINNPDGLLSIPDFMARWQAASALSTEVDQLRADPASTALVQTEQGYSNVLLDSLVQARAFYPWGSVWGRTEKNAAGLAGALKNIDETLKLYLTNIPQMITRARRNIQDREEVRIQEEIKGREAAIAASQAAAAASAAQTTISTAQNVQAQTTVNQLKTAELTSQVEYEKLVKKANAVTVFGVPLSVVAPLGIAAALGTVIVMRRKK